VTSYATRAARPADAEPLAAVHVRVWQEAYLGLMPPEHLAGLSVEAFVARWRTSLQDEATGTLDRRTAVLTADGEPVGFATIGRSRDDPPRTAHELYAVYVLPDHRGGGRADELVETAGRLAGAGRALSLWVLRGNERAHAFYRRNGFAPDGTTKEYPPATVPVERWVRP
jgi:GNAT superfamily N-acetyltransferase